MTVDKLYILVYSQLSTVGQLSLLSLWGRHIEYWLAAGIKVGVHSPVSDDDDDDDGDDDDEGRINFSMALSPKTTRTHNNKPKH